MCTQKFRVELEVDLPAGSTHSLEADQATGSPSLPLSLYNLCAMYMWMSALSCHPKANKLLDPSICLILFLIKIQIFEACKIALTHSSTNDYIILWRHTAWNWNCQVLKFQIKFNSHKIYGEGAFAHLFANWDQVSTNTDFSQYNITGCEFCYQPLHVIRRA